MAAPPWQSTGQIPSVPLVQPPAMNSGSTPQPWNYDPMVGPQSTWPLSSRFVPQPPAPSLIYRGTTRGRGHRHAVVMPGSTEIPVASVTSRVTGATSVPVGRNQQHMTHHLLQ